MNPVETTGRDNGCGSEVMSDEQEEMTQQRTVRKYDFSRPERKHSPGLTALRRAAAGLARNGAGGLTRLMRQETEIEPEDVQQCSWEHLLGQLTRSVVAFEFDVEKHGYRGLVTAGADLACRALERLTGNTDAADTPTSADLTNMEARLFGLWIRKFLDPLPGLWQGLGDFSVSVGGYIPDLHEAAPFRPSEGVFQVQFSVDDGVDTDEVSLCVSFQMVSELPREGQRDGSSEGGVEGHVRERLESGVRQVSLELSLDLGRAEVPAGQLLDLQRGDVVVLDSGMKDSLDVRINGRRKLKGYPVVSDGNLAVKIKGGNDREHSGKDEGD